MTEKPIIAVAGLVVAAVVGVAAYFILDSDSGEDRKIVLRASDWAREFKLFREDVEEINRIWGEPLPESLYFIGGLDWPAWGYFYLDPGDPPGIVRGQARDRTHCYVGTYQYVHPEKLPIENIDFDDFEITGLDGERLILHRCDQRPPVD